MNLPNYVRAKNADALMEAMINKNIETGSEQNYYMINVKDGWFYAWFYDRIRLPSRIANRNENRNHKSETVKIK